MSTTEEEAPLVVFFRLSENIELAVVVLLWSLALRAAYPLSHAIVALLCNVGRAVKLLFVGSIFVTIGLMSWKAWGYWSTLSVIYTQALAFAPLVPNWLVTPVASGIGLK